MKNKKKASSGQSINKAEIVIAKGTINKIRLGQSFAEYDRTLTKAGVFVETPAIKAALDASRSKCFFVGRRGTGKTAITNSVLARNSKTATQVRPQVFAPLGRYFKAK